MSIRYRGAEIRCPRCGGELELATFPRRMGGYEAGTPSAYCLDERAHVAGVMVPTSPEVERYAAAVEGR